MKLNPFRRREPASQPEPLSPSELYLAGGGNLDTTNDRVRALLAEADRGHHRHRAEKSVASDPLHAYEVSASDAAVMRMMAGASFGPSATVTLPSGRTITGSEMQKWIEAQ